jgi:hypothetical protein
MAATAAPTRAERRIQAAERAAAAAEQANHFERQKLCLKVTGRLCPELRGTKGKR